MVWMGFPIEIVAMADLKSRQPERLAWHSGFSHFGDTIAAHSSNKLYLYVIFQSFKLTVQTSE
jgi:hypothetical protein